MEYRRRCGVISQEVFDLNITGVSFKYMLEGVGSVKWSVSLPVHNINAGSIMLSRVSEETVYGSHEIIGNIIGFSFRYMLVAWG